MLLPWRQRAEMSQIEDVFTEILLNESSALGDEEKTQYLTTCCQYL